MALSISNQKVVAKGGASVIDNEKALVMPAAETTEYYDKIKILKPAHIKNRTAIDG